MRLIAGLATLLSVLCLATGVSAHAVLISMEPADGSVVSVAPKTVQLNFNQPVTPAAVKLIDAAGTTRDDPGVHAIDNTVVVMLPEGLPQGTHIISYRVVSEDGHPVAGSMAFSIGAATGSARPGTGAGPRSALIWLARLGVYLGLMVGVGGAFFAGWIGRGRAGARLTVAALGLGLLGAVASLGLQGLDLLDLPLAGIVTVAPWKAAALTSLFQSLLISGVAMTAAIVALRSEVAGTAALLSAFALASVGLALASSGHAASASPQWLTRPAVFVHGVGAAFWAGALGPLAAMAWRRSEGLPAVLHRFSRAAVPVVGLLVLIGLVLAIIQVESFHALIDTRYGNILLIKIMLVAALLGLAALNRFRLTPALSGDLRNTRSLLRSILLECAVVAGILALVAGWRFTPPPRALAAAVVTPLAIHIHTDNAMFQVLVSPGKVGSDDFVLQLMNGDGSPLSAREVTLTLSLPERGIEPLERAARLGPDGFWHVAGVPLPVAGGWHLRIDALITDFQKTTLEDDFELAPR